MVSKNIINTYLIEWNNIYYLKSYNLQMLSTDFHVKYILI